LKKKTCGLVKNRKKAQRDKNSKMTIHNIKKRDILDMISNMYEHQN
jgi:hypothetical protein